MQKVTIVQARCSLGVSADRLFGRYSCSDSTTNCMQQAVLQHAAMSVVPPFQQYSFIIHLDGANICYSSVPVYKQCHDLSLRKGGREHIMLCVHRNGFTLFLLTLRFLLFCGALYFRKTLKAATSRVPARKTAAPYRPSLAAL